MKKIKGNKILELQIKTATENEIGEHVTAWRTVAVLTGFLDLSNGDNKYTAYNAKIEESTHVFICNHQILDQRAKSENTRIYDPNTDDYYDIMLIDNPMGLNYQFEIYLKYTGGQHGEDK